MVAVLADDEEMIRDAIATTLETTYKMQVLTAKDAFEAVSLTRSHNPGLVILDLLMHGMDTFEATTTIRHMAPHTKVMIWSSRPELDLLIRAREVKAHAFVLKTDTTDELHYAIKTILRGGIYAPPSLSHLLLEPGRPDRSAFDGLTPKEKAVLTLVSQGMPMKEVASNLSISIKTAETHRNNLGRKLGYPNKAQIFAFALRHHLVDDHALAITA